MASTDQDLAVSSLLRRYRLAAGLSQDALAERAGLSLDAVGAIERGLRRPRRPTLQALARALGLSTVQLASLEMARRRTGRPRRVVHTPGLPLSTTALLGREHDVAIVSYLLRVARERLLTLTGTGGVGKTRLAQQTALEVADVFPDGVIWVDLAPLRDPELVAPTIAQLVGVLDTEATPLQERLVAELRQKRLLLVLDNFEQVLAARTVPEQVLASCPGVSIMVTSRAALGLVGEQEYVVAPLRLPGPLETTPEEVQQVPAVALFIQRARAAEPGLVLTGATAPIVAELCRRFDGLPLAIELAARLVRVLPPAAMLEQISRRQEEVRSGRDAATLAVLGGGAWSLPDRHQTLRTALAWSYDLLRPPEQALFRQVCVFVGGWTLEAAVAVCRPEGAESDTPSAVQAGLEALVAQSLVHMVSEGADGARRYGVLETVRVYGLERLEANGEATPVRDRHLAWCLAVAEQAELALSTPEQAEWLARLDRELPNVRAAIAHAEAEAHGTAAGLRLIAALWLFWKTRGHLVEVLGWLGRLLPRSDRVPPIVRAKALHAAGRTALYTSGSELSAAQAWLRESAALYRAMGDRPGLARVLEPLGTALHHACEYPAAMAAWEECLALRRELGDTLGIGWVLNNLGLGAQSLGDLARATAFWTESLRLLRAQGDPHGVANTLCNLGISAREQGNMREACALLRESLAMRRDLQDTPGIIECLEEIALVEHEGRPAWAARLLGAAEHLREVAGVALSAGQATHYGWLIAVRDALRDGDVAPAWAAGRALSPEEAVAEALAGDPRA